MTNGYNLSIWVKTIVAVTIDKIIIPIIFASLDKFSPGIWQ